MFWSIYSSVHESTPGASQPLNTTYQIKQNVTASYLQMNQRVIWEWLGCLRNHDGDAEDNVD